MTKMSKEKQTYNPCDDCQYSYSKNNQESGMCKICEFPYFRDRKQSEGEWLVYRERTPFGKVYYICSRCGRIEYTKEPYCNCGARMKGKSNEN